MLWILSAKVAGFCRFLCVYVCTSFCLCVSRPLWSPLIPNLTDLLTRQPLMCAESLSGILDAVSIIFNSYSLIRNPLFCFYAGKHTRTMMPGLSSRTGGCCVMSLFTPSGVFLPVFCSVILHLWALLIPFLSCVSPLIFDPNLKPLQRLRQHGLRGVYFHCMYLTKNCHSCTSSFSFSPYVSERLPILLVICVVVQI